MELNQIKEKFNKIYKAIEENNIEDISENDIIELTENLFSTMTMRTREAKINSAVGAIAVAIARQKNDPLYHKLQKYKKLWKETKAQIISRYGAIAYQKWIQNQAKKAK